MNQQYQRNQQGQQPQQQQQGNNSQSQMVPEAKAALDNMKFEIDGELGIIL